MAASRGTPWTTREIETIVEDYFDMLETELAGGAVVKAERNRTLQNVIDRSRGSIEYKHQNISAVMAALGLPFIQGYKPAVNYQHALFDAIEARIIGSDISKPHSRCKCSQRCLSRDPGLWPSARIESPAAGRESRLESACPKI